eukprot:2820388-Amphidinium_carterae.1
MMQAAASPQAVSGRATYSRLLEFLEEGAVQRVEIFENGRNCLAQVKVGERSQRLLIDLPGVTPGLIEKFTKAGVAID